MNRVQSGSLLAFDPSSSSVVKNNVSAFWLVAAVLIIGIEAAAVLSGGDASWDLRNYHLYSPFALLHKQPGTDIAPAHMQGFLPPTLDLLYYAVARAAPTTWLLNALLALPQSLAALLAFTLSWRLVRPRGLLEIAALGLLTAVAATGVAAFGTIAMSGSEILPVAFVLGAWLLLIWPDLAALPTLRRLFCAGLLVGAACGLKLTLSFATAAMILVVLFLIPRRRWTDWLTRPMALGFGILFGMLALAGYWWLHLWVQYGNPFFPLMNQIFRSPLAVPESFVDPTFLPRSLGQALQAPWSWALRLSWEASESRLRDPRFSLALLAAGACLLRAGLSRPRWRPWPMVVLPAWFIVAFVLWRLEFSIIRYLSVVEILSGAMLAMALFPLSRRLARPGMLATCSAAILTACLALTVYPNLTRTPSGSRAPFDIDLGPLPSNSTVLLLDNEPLAYLAAFVDPRIRFVGTNDFFMSLDGTNPMQKDVARAIGNAAGPLWGLDAPATQGDRSAATLAHYGLARGACRAVITNLSPDPIRLCELSASLARSS